MRQIVERLLVVSGQLSVVSCRMHLLYSHQQGAAIGLIKVHPTRRRFVAFSATVDDAVLWGWDYGCLERVARLGARQERRATREFRMFGSELEVRQEFF